MKTKKTGGRIEGKRHPTEDELELFALNKISDPRCIEEHLLLCGDCQKRFELTDLTIYLIRQALSTALLEILPSGHTGALAGATKRTETILR